MYGGGEEHHGPQIQEISPSQTQGRDKGEPERNTPGTWLEDVQSPELIFQFLRRRHCHSTIRFYGLSEYFWSNKAISCFCFTPELAWGN